MGLLAGELQYLSERFWNGYSGVVGNCGKVDGDCGWKSFSAKLVWNFSVSLAFFTIKANINKNNGLSHARKPIQYRVCKKHTIYCTDSLHATAHLCFLIFFWYLDIDSHRGFIPILLNDGCCIFFRITIV